MRVKIEFHTDNAAFDEWDAEVEYVLNNAANLAARAKVEGDAGGSDGFASSVVSPLRDSNGNMIGSVIVTADDAEG